MTTNLADFGNRELEMVRDLLTAMIEQGLPDDFCNDEVVPMFNQSSGYVFLTNSEHQVAMINGDKLESFYSSPYEGLEGFYDDLKEQYEDMHEDDKEWFDSLK
tara:strand:- start:14463 stop:14771 length:309 start_codon:yes stop_codon:yes gene_type:complete